MNRFTIPTRDEAPAASQPLLDAVNSQLGTIPNLFRLVALSPAALQGFLSLSGALGRALDVKTRERIALAVAEVNGCNYCLSAHTYLGLHLARLDETEIAANRLGHSHDARADAAVAFAKKVVETRGKVSEADLAAVKLGGFSEGQIVEIVVTVALNVLTNFVNNVADTPIDFPVVRAHAA
jgi:uncharacterized peroxidase-related enzyme